GISTPSAKIFNTTKNRFIFWRQHSRSFDGLTTFRSFSASLPNAENVSGLRVSDDFFQVFAVTPTLGRPFSTDENAVGGPKVVIISDGLWKKYFGGTSDVLQQSMRLNDADYKVVGVMPSGFWFETTADVLTPLQIGTTFEEKGGGANYPVVGRLKSDVSHGQAMAEMKLISDQFQTSYPGQLIKGEGINIINYRDYMVGEIRLPLLVLLAAVALVLLIACANVANLQLTRAFARGREMAIRAAIGASRWRVVRQLLTEGALLSLIGGVAGLLLAAWGVTAFRMFIPEGFVPRANQIGFSREVLLFTCGVSALAAILFGLAPAVQSARVDLTSGLKEASSTGTTSKSRGLFRSGLVVVQTSLAIVLLIGATLLIRTFVNLREVDPGFDSTHLLTFEIAPRGPRYETTAQVTDFNQRAIEKIKSLPGVQAVATTNTLPLNRWLNLPLEFEGAPDQIVSAEWRMISADYFDAMKMRVVRGRGISDTDAATAPGVVVVNEAFSRRYFKDREPLRQRMIVGKSMGEGLARSTPLEVVGVVSDSKQRSLIDPAPPTIYVPTAQVPDPLMANFLGFYFVIRTTADPESYAVAVRNEMRGLDNELPVRNMRTMDQVIGKSISPQRFNMMLLTLFGAIGLALASIGIYGVMAYTVSQRTREIGIRMALGAQVKDVLRMVLRQGMRLTLIGLVLGLATAFALTRVLKTLLFGVTPTDLSTFVFVSVALVAMALVACFIPARRATKVDPLVALRYE
ncbi:MAG TPA: ABC transporter permease, partial [Pyrinomonadaceae bacterium]